MRSRVNDLYRQTALRAAGNEVWGTATSTLLNIFNPKTIACLVCSAHTFNYDIKSSTASHLDKALNPPFPELGSYE